MRFSIGLRLFISVLLAMLAVAGSGIALMRHQVLQGFSEYAVNIELDRLEVLAQDLASRYRDKGSWDFVPATQPGKRAWIGAELARLQSLPVPALPAVPPASEAAPALPPLPLPRAAPAAAPVPPAPPAPPAPPVPPAPPAPAEPVPPVDELDLPDRVTLLDGQGRYLAGRVPGSEPAARRAIENSGHTVGFLRVARVLRPSDALAAAFLGQLATSFWLIVASGLALSALAAVLLARHFRKPIRSLALGAHLLAEGRFDTRLAVDRSDELGELAGSFNQLAQRLGAMEDSRRQWVADTSHELRTPLAVLRAQLEAIEDGVRPADPATVAAMLRQVLALNKLIDQLYALARADALALDCERTPFDLWALASETAAAFGDRLRAAGLQLELGAPPAASRVLADPDRMRQVLGNLFENALRYTEAPGRVAMHARAEQRQLVLTIEDSAPGVPDDALARLAQRFYRLDASRSRAHGGAGLGLALCQRILEAHHASLAFDHSPLGGLRVTLTFALEQP